MSAQAKLKLKKDVAPYEKSNLKSSLWQVGNTVVPFFLLWYLAYVSISLSYWLTIGLSIAAAGFLIRTFILFHDCCHHSFFKSRLANEILGTLTGILTMFPYHKWKNEHAIHHATSGNLDKRGTGDLWILTVDEYAASPFHKRLAYRLYRNPLVMFGLGPLYIFVIANRFNAKKAKLKVRLNTYLTNAAVIGIPLLICSQIGWQSFLLIQGPIFLLSGAAGVWLFYVQHQFEDTYFAQEPEWNFVSAAVEGSSYYKLPGWLQWLTGNIGFHHVHHLSPKVPNYNLEAAHNHTPALQAAPTIDIPASLKAIRYRLWDEKNTRFVGFKEARSMSGESRQQ
ncbi:fatty acid desaturase [Paenibacillus nasutitermitis]|uniref:Fatty acid desaturase n=1 Tax=Paenibacillus nasutitermitis TaxID=1652958 RepID=A0A917DND8_9BACL|nr:fatty acid desaturase [Paenibacillus nasutitermitis]GGD55619.1 fatty acid desaturase [Paenibacillus nasutitermitis]